MEYVRWSVSIAGLVGGGGNVAEGLKHLEVVLGQITGSGASGSAAAPAPVVSSVDAQAVLLLQLEITRRQLSTGVEPDAIKDRLTDSKKALDHYSGVMDARVYAAYYQAYYEYSKLRGNPQEYYTNSLLYLTYTPLSDLSTPTKQSLASDIGLSALLGINIYNFGELLQHPILASLEGTKYAWLPSLLRAFNAGNIAEFNNIFGQVKDEYVRIETQRSEATTMDWRLHVALCAPLLMLPLCAACLCLCAAHPCCQLCVFESEAAHHDADGAGVPSAIGQEQRSRRCSLCLCLRPCRRCRCARRW